MHRASATMQGAADVRHINATMSIYVATPPVSSGPAEGLACQQRMVIGMDDVWGMIPAKSILAAFPWMINRYLSGAQAFVNSISRLPAGPLCGSISVLILVVALMVFASMRCRDSEEDSARGKWFVRGVRCLAVLLLSPLLLAAIASALAVAAVCVAFPLLAKAQIGHVDYSILFCFGKVGFSRFMIVPYVVKVLNGFGNVWKDPARTAEVESHASMFKLGFWVLPLTNSSVWITAKCWDAMTHWSTYVFQPSCPAAEFQSFLVISLTHVLLTTSVMATISVLLLIIIGRIQMSRKSFTFAIIYHWFFELLLQDIPQAYALFLVVTSCQDLDQYAYYSLAISTVGCTCALTAIVRRCNAPPGASYEPLEIEGCVDLASTQPSPKYSDLLRGRFDFSVDVDGDGSALVDEP